MVLTELYVISYIWQANIFHKGQSYVNVNVMASQFIHIHKYFLMTLFLKLSFQMFCVAYRDDIYISISNGLIKKKNCFPLKIISVWSIRTKDCIYSSSLFKPDAERWHTSAHVAHLKHRTLGELIRHLLFHAQFIWLIEQCDAKTSIGSFYLTRFMLMTFGLEGSE